MSEPIRGVETAVREFGALPVPAGPQSLGVLDRARNALGARMSKDDLRLVLENVIVYAAGLEVQRDRIAELEKQVRLLNTQRGDVAQLIEREGGHGEECVDVDDLVAALCLGSDEFGSGGA